MNVAEYLNRVRDDLRETAFNQIIKGREVKKALAEPVGKMILEAPVEQYREKLLIMLDIAMDTKLSEKNRAEKIIETGREVRAIQSFLNYLASILTDYYAHLKEMEKTK